MRRQALVHQQHAKDTRGCGQAASVRNVRWHRIAAGWSRGFGDLRMPKRLRSSSIHGTHVVSEASARRKDRTCSAHVIS